MNYTLNQLVIFLKVVEEQSITKAAESLFLTQPAVSIQLKNFQEQFDFPLIEIIGRKLYVTDLGREIAISAKNIIDEVQQINNKALTQKGVLTGKLNIAVVSTAKYIMPYFLSGFLKEHEGIQLNMDVTNKQKVIQSLENNEVDFALVSILPNYLQVESMDLLTNKMYLIGSSGSRLNYSGKAFDFKNESLIFREDGSGTRQTMEQFVTNQAVNVFKKLELTSNEAVKQAVMADLGFSIMPLIGIKNELINNELEIIPFEGLPITTTWKLIWLKGKKHSAVSKAYLDYLKIEKKQIIDKYFKWYENYN